VTDVVSDFRDGEKFGKSYLGNISVGYDTVAKTWCRTQGSQQSNPREAGMGDESGNPGNSSKYRFKTAAGARASEPACGIAFANGRRPRIIARIFYSRNQIWMERCSKY